MRLILLLFLLFALSISGQTPVEPIKVFVAAGSGDQIDREVSGYVRGELNKLRYIEFVSKGSPAHFNIIASAAPLTGLRQCSGFSAVLFIEAKERNKQFIYAGSDLPSLARHLVKRLEREFFQPQAKRR